MMMMILCEQGVFLVVVFFLKEIETLEIFSGHKMRKKGPGASSCHRAYYAQEKTKSNLLKDHCEWTSAQAQIAMIKCLNTSNNKWYEVAEDRDQPQPEGRQKIKTKAHVSVFNKISLGFDLSYIQLNCRRKMNVLKRITERLHYNSLSMLTCKSNVGVSSFYINQ